MNWRTAGLLALGLFGAVVLLVLIVPALFQYRDGGDIHSLCINNLRLIDHAKEALSIKHDWTDGYVIADTPEAIWAALDPYIDGTNQLSCEQPEGRGKHYIYGAIGTTPRCPVADIYTEHVYRPD